MGVLEDLLRGAQPGYETQVQTILQRLLDTFGEAAFEGVDRAGFALHAIGLLERSNADISVRLWLLRGLWSLGWWCDAPVGDREIADLSALTRKIHFQTAKGVGLLPCKARPEALRRHAVFVGALVGLMHSPTRGSFDYVRALAANSDNAHIDVFHLGTLTPAMRAYGDELFGQNAARVAYVSMEENLDWFARATSEGPYTYHFWCEDALAQHISLLAMLGPTVMFTCGDVAPVQFADVYWYGHDAAYMAALWRRQGAPEGFVRNYRFLQSTPLNLPTSKARRTRRDLDLGDDDIVVVSAGNRLGADLDQPFVDGLATFLRGHPQIRWMAVGGLHDYWISTFKSVLGRQFVHIPYDHDLPSLFAVCDIFANPFRAGGGHSSVIAINAGAVVLARGDLGDVGALVPAPHRARDAPDYFAKLDGLAGDPGQRATWAKAQQAHLAMIGDQAAFAAELGAVCDLAYRRFGKRLPVVREALFAQ
jgi:hypothetical protein